MNIRRVPSNNVTSYPPGEHPKASPIRSDLTAVHCAVKHPTVRGAFVGRWFGVEKAWIGSDLNFYVAGFDSGFEEMMAWPKPSRAMRKECERLAGCPDCHEVDGHKAWCAPGGLS